MPQAPSASVLHLHRAILALAPELAELPLPDEPLADCANCPLAGQPFHPTVRCCTYEPALPNFLVGRALARDNTGAEKIRERIAAGAGVGRLGIQPSAEWLAEYAQRRDTDFGRNPDWRCPYWVDGPLSCSIWPDRNTVCRSWHCKHSDGFRGHELWTRVRKLGAACERRLSGWCAEQLTPPKNPSVPGWESYYRACAQQVEHATEAQLAALADPQLQASRAELRQAWQQLTQPIPEVLGVEVRAVIERGDQVELVGYSPWNSARFPRSVFALLAEFDGERPRDQAVQRALATNPEVQAHWVETLFEIRVLRPREADDAAPWGFGAPDLDPEELKQRFTR